MILNEENLTNEFEVIGDIIEKDNEIIYINVKLAK